MLVSAPASSANLGPGFDCLALALGLRFWLSTQPHGAGSRGVDAGSVAPDRPLRAVESTHPAAVAFRHAGGSDQPLWWASGIPPGRGLGFSGASRVAGAFAALVLADVEPSEAREGAYQVARALEGHGDNAAASTYGGFVVSVGETVVPVTTPPGLSVVAWSPDTQTSTKASREALPEVVPFEDATAAVAGGALWVAAIAAGRPELIRAAGEERLHQPARLAAQPRSAAVLAHLLGMDGVFTAWLSGSGPTVAALVRSDDGKSLAADEVLCGFGGEIRVLRIEPVGVTQS